MFGTLLVAIDGKEPSHRAVLAARELASFSQGTIRLLHVRESLSFPSGQLGPDEYDEEQPDEVDRLVAQERAVVEELGIPVTSEVREASSTQVAPAILDAASACSADLVVMGSRGLSSLGALLVGSNTYKVLHLSELPVLVVQ